MRKVTYSVLLLLLLAGAFLAGSWYHQRGTVAFAKAEARGELDSTHSAQHVGSSGVALASAVPPEHAHDGASNLARHSAPSAPGTVNISVEKQLLIGVRVRPVEKVSGTSALRLFGRVTPDEGRVYKVNAGVDGYIRDVSSVTTGTQVEKDQWLVTFFSLESRTPIQAYLTALDVLDRAARTGEKPEQIRSGDATSQLGVERLKNVGMSAIQIEEIRRTREVPLMIRILAPANGFVLARNASLGQKFEKGTEWYRIADLRRVWILADVFENDAQYLRPGVRAQVSLHNQRKTLPARVTEVLPQFDAATRTLKVRLEADNPDYVLRPDMFVDVELAVILPAAVAVPVDAVLDSGITKTVFVEHGEGVFEPRQVDTGWRFGDRLEIVRGVLPGERIVTAGAFLLDSESRMKAAAPARSTTSSTLPPAHAEAEPGARARTGHH